MKKTLTEWAVTALCTAMFATSALAQGSTKLSDPEVASVALVANQIDIAYADIAKKRSKDREVI